MASRNTPLLPQGSLTKSLMQMEGTSHGGKRRRVNMSLPGEIETLPPSTITPLAVQIQQQQAQEQQTPQQQQLLIQQFKAQQQQQQQQQQQPVDRDSLSRTVARHLEHLRRHVLSLTCPRCSDVVPSPLLDAVIAPYNGIGPKCPEDPEARKGFLGNLAVGPDALVARWGRVDPTGDNVTVHVAAGETVSMSLAQIGGADALPFSCGFLARKCRNCRSGYCGLCYIDCGGATEAHLNGFCSVAKHYGINSARTGNMIMGQWYAIQRDRMQQSMDGYLANITDPNIKSFVIAKIAPDCAHAGIVPR